MILNLHENDKALNYIDRFGKKLEAGNTFRLYIKDDNFYGRPVIVGYKDGYYFANIPEWKDRYGLNYYFEGAASEGWDSFEIVSDYPDAEPHKL